MGLQEIMLQMQMIKFLQFAKFLWVTYVVNVPVFGELQNSGYSKKLCRSACHKMITICKQKVEPASLSIHYLTRGNVSTYVTHVVDDRGTGKFFDYDFFF